MQKPQTLIGREQQWRAVERFLFEGEASRTLRFGLVSGRRRTGKTQLLVEACRQSGGMYHVCVQDEGDRAARLRFAQSIAAHAGIGASTVSGEPEPWELLLRTALDTSARTAPSGMAPFVVIDEFPYAMAHAAQLPSLIQHLYDDAQHDRGPGGRLIVCGSALSVMQELLSGTKALRGRASMDMRMTPLDYREAARLWGVTDPEVALRLHATVGGIPGYRALIHQTPRTAQEFDQWVVDNLLTVDVGVFTRTEVDYLLREDPRITNRAGYNDLLSAVAGGAPTPAKIAGALGRSAESLRYPIEVLESAGYLTRSRDLLRRNKTTIAVTDPVILFDRLITAPHLGQLELGRGEHVWTAAAPTFRSQILGPHLEDLARDWLMRFAPDELEQPAGFGDVGVAHAHDHAGRARHEIDLMAVRGKQVTFLGEAKATLARRGMPDLERLDTLKAVLSRLGYGTTDTVIGVFSRTGFTTDLERAAAGRRDLELIGLERLYGV